MISHVAGVAAIATVAEVWLADVLFLTLAVKGGVPNASFTVQNS
jgi:hypothetical protein